MALINSELKEIEMKVGISFLKMTQGVTCKLSDVNNPEFGFIEMRLWIEYSILNENGIQKVDIFL